MLTPSECIQAQIQHPHSLGIIGQQQNGAWSYFGYDGLGSVRHLTDEYGSITARMSYDPYGAPLQPNTASSLGFTGELTDPTGLVYLRARTYNPALGIFTQRDPVLGVAGLSASYNGYGYVHGNPTNYRDPSGKCVWQPGVDLISCGLENAGLLLGQIGSIFSTTHQYADEAWQASWQKTWANGFEGYVDLQLASLRHLIDFTLLVGVPMFFPPAAVIVTGTDLAQSWAEGTLKPIDVLLFAAGLGKFGQMATIRSVEEEIARNILRAEQRNSERIFSSDFQVDETGRIRVGRNDQPDFGTSLRRRRAWYGPEDDWTIPSGGRGIVDAPPHRLPTQADIERVRQQYPSIGANDVVSILQAGGKWFVGRNGRNPMWWDADTGRWRGYSVIPQANSHAEVDALNALLFDRRATGNAGGSGYMIVDTKPCGYCYGTRYMPGIPRGFRATGLASLDVLWPTGSLHLP